MSYFNQYIADQHEKIRLLRQIKENIQKLKIQEEIINNRKKNNTKGD